MLYIEKFILWFIGHFDLRFIFIPFAIKNIAPVDHQNRMYIGYMDIFIFGIRIARIQKTKPWIIKR